MSMSKLAKDQLKFVDPPTDEFNCPICLGILQEPYLTACCGNHFCEACIEKVKEGTNKCPLCQETPLHGIVNKSVRRKLNALRVYCTHKGMGCKWIGDLGKLDQHLAIGETQGECQFVMIKCTVSRLCESEITRRSLIYHISYNCDYRQFKCKYCGYQSTFIAITTMHYDQCPDYPVYCPNECSNETYRRAELEAHLASCPEQEVDCTFSEVGCKQKMKRHQFQQHLETNLVQHQLAMFATMKRDKEELQKQVCILTKESAVELKDTNWPQYLYKMRQITSFCQETPAVFYVPFEIRGYETCDANLHLPLGNWSEAALPYHSPLFYSHPNGYKLQLVANLINYCSGCLAESFPSGKELEIFQDRIPNGKIFCVSVDLHIVNGEHNTNLKWPFKAQIAVTLLNQKANDCHLKKEKYYKGECNQNKATQLIAIRQDTKFKQINELNTEYESLSQEATIQAEKFWDFYENMHELNHPNALLFPLFNKEDLSKLYFEVTINF